MYSLKSSSARIVWKIEKKGCLQRGHSALFFDHSWTQRKQNLCKQRSRYATLSNLSKQMGHLESGDASVGSLLVLAFGEKLLSSENSLSAEAMLYKRKRQKITAISERQKCSSLEEKCVTVIFKAVKPSNGTERTLNKEASRSDYFSWLPFTVRSGSAVLRVSDKAWMMLACRKVTGWALFSSPLINHCFDMVTKLMIHKVPSETLFQKRPALACEKCENS